MSGGRGSGTGFVVEESSAGRTLVVTGPWTPAAGDVLASGAVDGLDLNYARGFQEPDLEFLEGWRLRRLHVLDRGLADLEPIARFGDSLTELSVQAAPSADLDLGWFPHLRDVAGEWGILRDTLPAVDTLSGITTWQFDDSDLHAFRDHVDLQRLTIKEAPHLESLAGVGALTDFEVFFVGLARRLRDISDVTGLGSSLREFKLQACPAVGSIDDVEPLVNLRLLGVSDCQEIESLAPVASLEQLETLYAWGSTRVVDGDLSPLIGLPRLREVRMRDRRDYTPRLADVIGGFAS
jgi:hypothetical protein